MDSYTDTYNKSTEAQRNALWKPETFGKILKDMVFDMGVRLDELREEEVRAKTEEERIKARETRFEEIDKRLKAVEEKLAERRAGKEEIEKAAKDVTDKIINLNGDMKDFYRACNLLGVPIEIRAAIEGAVAARLAEEAAREKAVEVIKKKVEEAAPAVPPVPAVTAAPVAARLSASGGESKPVVVETPVTPQTPVRALLSRSPYIAIGVGLSAALYVLLNGVLFFTAPLGLVTNLISTAYFVKFFSRLGRLRDEFSQKKEKLAEPIQRGEKVLKEVISRRMSKDFIAGIEAVLKGHLRELQDKGNLVYRAGIGVAYSAAGYTAGAFLFLMGNIPSGVALAAFGTYLVVSIGSLAVILINANRLQRLRSQGIITFFPEREGRRRI
ncbi:MAG: hypothetical protein Q8Q87_03590, partial [Candidatus Omnitrophota bacterium]|nr:hypothetical protein [Candidatus Omnitrophota bacterium]